MPKIEVFETHRKPTAASAVSPGDLYARQQFEAGLRWLESRGMTVERHAISLGDLTAMDNGAVKTAIELQGEDSLPSKVDNFREVGDDISSYGET